MLAPTRLTRLELQHAANSTSLGVAELTDKLIAATLPDSVDALAQRIAYRTIITLAQAARDPATTPEVAAVLDRRVHEIASALARRSADQADSGWGATLSRQLLDPQQLEKLVADRPRSVDLPPGDPIGGESDWMDFREASP